MTTLLSSSHRHVTAPRNGSAILPMMTVFTLLIVLVIAAVAATTAVWALVAGAGLLVLAIAGGVGWLMHVLGDDA